MEQLAIDIATKFTADVSGLTQGAQQAAGAYNQVAQSQTAVGEASTKASGGVKLLGAAMKGLLALGVIKFLQGAIMSFEESERATYKLTGAMANNADMSKVSQAEWENLAKEVQGYSRFSDEAATSTIALYGNMGMTADQIQTLIPLTADLAEKLGTDMEGAAMRVTRAMAGQARSLQMAGIDMRGLAEASDKTAFVMERLTKQVGGFAAQTQDLMSTQLAQLGNMFDDIKEKIGSGLMPVVVAIVRYGFKPLVDTIGKIPAPVLTAAAAFAGLVTVGRALKPVFGIVGNAFQTLGKLGGMFTDQTETATDATEGLGTSMDSLASTFSNSNTSIQTVITRMAMMQTGTMANASAQEKLAAALLMTTSAQERQAAVVAIKASAEKLANTYVALGMKLEEARSRALDQTTAAIARQAEAQALLNAQSAKGGQFIGKLGTALGAVGVVAAVATVAWAAGSAILGYFAEKAKEAELRLTSLRESFVKSIVGTKDAAKAYEAYAAAVLDKPIYGFLDRATQSNYELALSSDEVGQRTSILAHQQKLYREELAAASAEQRKYTLAMAAQAKVTAALDAIEERHAAHAKTLVGAQEDIVAAAAKAADGFSMMGLSVTDTIRPVLDAQQALIGFQGSIETMAQQLGVSSDDIKAAIDGDTDALARLGEDGTKFVEDFTKAQDEMAASALESFQTMKEAVVDWENSFADSINGTIDRFTSLAEEGKASYDELMGAMRDSQKEMQRFGSLSRRILAAGGKDAKPFIEAMTKLGVDAIPIMVGALEKGKKGVDEFVTRFNKTNSAADQLADTLSHALVGALKPIAQGFAAMLEAAGVKVPNALAKAAGSADDFKNRFSGAQADARAEIADTEEKLAGLSKNITQLPNGKFVVDAETVQAYNEMETFVNRYDNKIIHMVADIGVAHGGGLIGMHTGGSVERYHQGGPLKNDERLAVLQTGEFVIQRSAVKKFGRDFFAALNKGAPQVYRGSDMSMSGPGAGRDIHMDIEVNPVIDRTKFVKEVTYSTRVTGR